MDERQADAVAATFGLGSVESEPTLAARGANGFIWKVTTDRGAYAVKRLQPWVAPVPVPFDVGVQLAAATVGIALPRPVVTSDGAAMVDGTRVYEWVDLAEPHPTPVGPDVAGEVGGILGRLHRLALPPDGPVDRWYEVPPTRDEWVDVERRGRVAGAPWSAWLADEIDFLDELGHRVAEPRSGPAITCHRDFAPGNVLPSADDGRLVVLDWENAGAMPADAELAWTIVFWAANGERVDVDAADTLLDAYRDASGSTPEVVPSSFHVALVTHLNFLKVNLDQSLEATLQGEFNDRWIEQLEPASLRRRLPAIALLRDRLCG